MDSRRQVVMLLAAVVSLTACAHPATNACGRPVRPVLAPPIHVRPETSARGLTILALDATSNEPIAGARVSLLDSPIVATTDSLGLAYLAGIAPGAVAVAVRAIGRSPILDTLNISATRGRFLIVQLKADVICLEDPIIAVPPAQRP